MGRKFEIVKEDKRTAFSVLKDEKGATINIPKEIKLPTRGTATSAGYDFYAPKDLQLLPMQKTIVFTDVKAKMEEDEVLMIYIRSSTAIKKGLMLSNNVGIIDSDYYGNPDNDGNIGIPLVNTTGKAVNIEEGERIAQGIFTKFLSVEEAKPAPKRKGGTGSTGTK